MPEGNCKFNGSGRDYISVFVIHLFLLSAITLGIYAPWAWVRLFKLKASHTVINEKPVTFTGTGSSLFRICLVNLLLILITFGFYSPWAACRFQRWKAQNTLVDGKESRFRGTGGALFLFYLVHLTLLPLATFGLYYFYGIYRYHAWKEEQMMYGGERTSFGSGFWAMMKIFLLAGLLWMAPPVAGRILAVPYLDLLSSVALILLSPWFISMFYRWQIDGLAVGDGDEVKHFPPVRTRVVSVIILIVALYLSLAATGYFLWKRYGDALIGRADMVSVVEMKMRKLKGPKTVRMPMENPAPPGSEGARSGVVPRKRPSASADGGKLRVADLIPGQAGKAVRSGNLDGKIRELGLLIAEDRKNADLYSNRGFLYAQKGDYVEAEKDFTRAIQINYRDRDAYYNRGLARVKMGKYSLAIQDFDKAMELGLQAVDTYCNRGNANFQLGKYDLALRDYNEALKIDPHDPDSCYNRGIAYLAKGMKSRAIKDFRKAASLGHKLASQMVLEWDRAGGKRPRSPGRGPGN